MRPSAIRDDPAYQRGQALYEKMLEEGFTCYQARDILQAGATLASIDITEQIKREKEEQESFEVLHRLAQYQRAVLQ